MEPKVAVIIPVYNMERYLRECLDSLVGQTFKDIEIICFNDASTDSSIDILREYAARDERFVIIDSPVNIKQGGGRNAGIRAARAPYIMFVDPDDWVEPDFVEKYYTKAVETGADIVTGDYNTVTDGNIFHSCGLGHNLPDDSSIIKRSRLERDVPIWINIYKRTLFFDNNLFFPENIQLGEDNAIACALFLASTKLRKIDCHLYNYRIHDKSSSHEYNPERFHQRYITAILARDNMIRISGHQYQKEINHLFLRYYYLQAILGALDGYAHVLYKEIRFANETVLDYVNQVELNNYISLLSKGLQFTIKICRISPALGSLFFRCLKIRANFI